MLDKFMRLSASHGELKPGRGLASGMVAPVQGIACLLGVLAFHFPQYLTTHELRRSCDLDLMRQLLYWGMVLGGAIALFDMVVGRARWLSAAAFALVLLALALGGARRRARLGGWVAGLNFWLALLLIVLAADLAQCWTHRACHELPALWRLHAVHHSVEHMDWMAGSRQHLLEVLITRTLVLAPIAVLGFAKEVIDACIVVVGFQAVFNHANVSVRLGPPRYLVVTPDFHHWHHAQDSEAIDRNCAAHFAFLDHLFGTAVQSGRAWPARYGIVGDYVPPGFRRQFLFPFTWNGKA